MREIDIGTMGYCAPTINVNVSVQTREEEPERTDDLWHDARRRIQIDRVGGAVGVPTFV